MKTSSMVLALSERLDNANLMIPVRVGFEVEYSRRGYRDRHISPWPSDQENGPSLKADKHKCSECSVYMFCTTLNEVLVLLHEVTGRYRIAQRTRALEANTFLQKARHADKTSALQCSF